MKLSIIIPCYNESSTISKILEKIAQTCNYDYEIIVVDDFSEDGSRAILNHELLNKKINHLILNTKNYGKGYSIRQGLKKTKNEIILIQDADLEYDPLDYNKLINPIINNEADVVYGSRFVGSGEKRVYSFNIYVKPNCLTCILLYFFTTQCQPFYKKKIYISGEHSLQCLE